MYVTAGSFNIKRTNFPKSKITIVPTNKAFELIHEVIIKLSSRIPCLMRVLVSYNTWMPYFTGQSFEKKKPNGVYDSGSLV